MLSDSPKGATVIGLEHQEGVAIIIDYNTLQRRPSSVKPPPQSSRAIVAGGQATMR